MSVHSPTESHTVVINGVVATRIEDRRILFACFIDSYFPFEQSPLLL